MQYYIIIQVKTTWPACADVLPVLNPTTTDDELCQAEFQSFVESAMPIVIENLPSNRYTIVETMRRATLERIAGNIDLLVSSIPYGEIFGKRRYCIIQIV